MRLSCEVFNYMNLTFDKKCLKEKYDYFLSLPLTELSTHIFLKLFLQVILVFDSLRSLVISKLEPHDMLKDMSQFDKTTK